MIGGNLNGDVGFFGWSRGFREPTPEGRKVYCFADISELFFANAWRVQLYDQLTHIIARQDLPVLTIF